MTSIDCMLQDREAEGDCKVYLKPSGQRKIALKGTLKTAKQIHKQQEMNNDIMKPSKYKDQRRREREVKWHEKVMHGQFFKDRDGIVDRKKSWLWLKNGDLREGQKHYLWRHKVMVPSKSNIIITAT